MDVKEEFEHMYEKKKGQAYYTNRHSCFLLQYHMVLVTKYRHPVLTDITRTGTAVFCFNTTWCW